MYGTVGFHGEWFYPNGSKVEGNGLTEGKYFFFRTRDMVGNVNLFRRNTQVQSPFGSYCCEIPNIRGVNQTLCVNLGRQNNIIYIYYITISKGYPFSCNKAAPSEFSFTIDDNGAAAIPGQNYSLLCSISDGDVREYRWWKDDAVLNDKTTRVLSFSPLSLSDAGRYTCEITVTVASQIFTIYQNHTVIIQSE